MRLAFLPLLILASPVLAEGSSSFGAGFCYERSFEAAAGTGQMSAIRFQDAPSGLDAGNLVSAEVVVTMAGTGRAVERAAQCQAGPNGGLACQVAGSAGGFVAVPNGSNVVMTLGEGGLLRGAGIGRAVVSNQGADRVFDMAPCR